MYRYILLAFCDVQCNWSILHFVALCHIICLIAPVMEVMQNILIFSIFWFWWPFWFYYAMLQCDI